MVATLVYHGRLKVSDVRDLTWLQIDAIYFHPRDEDGNLVAPKQIVRIEGNNLPAVEKTAEELEFIEKLGNLNEMLPMLGLNNYKSALIKLCDEYNQPLPIWFDSLPKSENNLTSVVKKKKGGKKNG